VVVILGLEIWACELKSLVGNAYSPLLDGDLGMNKPPSSSKKPTNDSAKGWRMVLIEAMWKCKYHSCI
jgi:hypothetical protein